MPSTPGSPTCERAGPQHRRSAGGAARLVGSPAGGGRGLVDHQPQRDPVRGGRVGLGQVGHGQVHSGPAAGTPRARRRWRHPFRESGPSHRRRGGDARHPGRAHLHDLSGADGGSEPAHEGGHADRRDLPRAHQLQCAGSPPAGGRAVLRRPPARSGEHHGQLPSRDLGRPAPAGDGRHGAGAGARSHHRRRTHHGAGRDHPGPDPVAAQGAAGQARYRGDVHHPRFRGRGGDRRPGGGDARRQARRVRRDRRCAAQPEGGLHPGAGSGGAQPAPSPRIDRRQAGAGADPRRAEQDLRWARGLVRRAWTASTRGARREPGGAPAGTPSPW